MKDFIVFLYWVGSGFIFVLSLVILVKVSNVLIDLDVKKFFNTLTIFRKPTETEKAVAEREVELDRRTALIMRETGWGAKDSFELAQSEYKTQMREASGRPEKEPTRRSY